ncbi:hypothetical protein RVM25_37060, partial [Enterobacter hormaechei subsp. xiangfangensis]
RLRLSYAADDLGLTSDPQFQTGRQEFINNGLAEWRNNEANKPKAKGVSRYTTRPSKQGAALFLT